MTKHQKFSNLKSLVPVDIKSRRLVYNSRTLYTKNIAFSIHYRVKKGGKTLTILNNHLEVH